MQTEEAEELGPQPTQDSKKEKKANKDKKSR